MTAALWTIAALLAVELAYVVVRDRRARVKDDEYMAIRQEELALHREQVQYTQERFEKELEAQLVRALRELEDRLATAQEAPPPTEEPPGLDAEEDDGYQLGDSMARIDAEERASDEALRTEILGYLAIDNESTASLLRMLGASEDRVRKALSDLQKQGLIRRAGRAGWARTQ